MFSVVFSYFYLMSLDSRVNGSPLDRVCRQLSRSHGDCEIQTQWHLNNFIVEGFLNSLPVDLTVLNSSHLMHLFLQSGSLWGAGFFLVNLLLLYRVDVSVFPSSLLRGNRSSCLLLINNIHFLVTWEDCLAGGENLWALTACFFSTA